MRNNMLGGVPTIKSREPGSINLEVRKDCVVRLSGLLKRYTAAREFVANLKPGEKIADFGPIPAAEDANLKELEALETDREALVEKLEARAEELERERQANMTEIDKLRAELNLQAGRIARLERLVAGTTVAPTTPAPQARAEIPQILVARQSGPRGAGLGGVSTSFGAPLSSDGGVRRLGNAT
jgi:hypothetical protein